MQPPPHERMRPRSLLLHYLLLVVVPGLAILLVLHLGAGPTPTAPRTTPPPAAAPEGATPQLELLLAQLLVVLVATRACGLAVRPLGQPHVVGEMLAGILLGPSLLGLFAPGLSAALFPASSLHVLGSLSRGGVVESGNRT